MVGKPCKPQNIQHLLDPENEVAHSKYTLDLAEVLECDPFWLGRNKGVKPVLRETGARTLPLKYPEGANNVALLAGSTVAPHWLWPFKSFTPEQFAELDSTLKDNFEAIILASIGNRGHPEKLAQPANTAAQNKAA
jgi:hypothetical protein